MFGGLLKSTSAVAIVAVAGLAMGAVSAQAADLGGDCCADLEERIAELEATTARKGNRKVSLTIYGQITTAVMFWEADNGRVEDAQRSESNVYVISPQTSGTRVGFKGGAKINSDWSASYRLELQWQTADADAVRANNDEGNDLPEFRQAYWGLKSKTYGEVRVGQTDMANSGIAEIDLSGTNIADGMSSSQAGDEIIDDFIGGPDLENFEFNRLNVVRYTSPVFAGFVASAAYGEDDIWDVALRYAGEIAGFKLAAGIAYGESSDPDNTSVAGYDPSNGGAGGSAVQLSGVAQGATFEPTVQVLNGGLSVMHVATGLFATGSAGERTLDQTAYCGAANANRDNTCDGAWFWFGKGGIKQKWLPIGSTALFGMGGEYKDEINDYTTYWGLGLVQKIDAAAMELYASYRHYDVKDEAGADELAHEGEFDTVVVGGRIKF